MSRNFLRIHGSILIIVGLVSAIFTIAGQIKNMGPYTFLYENKIASVGLFEAYLLAAVCGLFLVMGSHQKSLKKWHAMAAVIHLPLLITNSIYWNFYHQVNMETAGIFSTIAHVIFIVIELYFYRTKI